MQNQTRIYMLMKFEYSTEKQDLTSKEKMPITFPIILQGCVRGRALKGSCIHHVTTTSCLTADICYQLKKSYTMKLNSTVTQKIHAEHQSANNRTRGCHRLQKPGKGFNVKHKLWGPVHAFKSLSYPSRREYIHVGDDFCSCRVKTAVMSSLHQHNLSQQRVEESEGDIQSSEVVNLQR